MQMQAQLIQGIGRRAPFDVSRVSSAVRRALALGDRKLSEPAAGQAAEEALLRARTDAVVREVVAQLRRREFMRAGGGGAATSDPAVACMSSAELQDIVEACLVERGEYAGAKSYIVARVKREEGLD